MVGCLRRRGGACQDGAPTVDPAIFELGVPVLGICYGMQLMSQKLGGRVVPGESREYGKMPIEVMPGSPLFEGVPSTVIVWMSHGDRVEAIHEVRGINRVVYDISSKPPATIEWE